MNKVILHGNLGRDPELRYSASGTAVANINVATSFKTKDGNQTEWHRCVAFGKTAEIMGEHLSKGSKVVLEGRLQTRKWQDQQGQDRYTTEIVVDRFEFAGGGNGSNGGQRQQDMGGFRDAPADDDFNDDDIPF